MLMKRNWVRIGFLFLSVISVGLIHQPFSASAKTTIAKQGSVEFIPGQFVVRLKENATEKGSNAFARIAERLSSNKTTKLTFDSKVFMTSNLHGVIRVTSKSEISNSLNDVILQNLKNDPMVAIAEPNFIYRASDGPNDPKLNELWGMKNSGQNDSQGIPGLAGADIGVAAVWAEGRTGSKSIKVAIIDTGGNFTHPDLSANLIPGFNFVNNTANATDDNNHGSHCAGTIGGIGNNSTGVVGVNWNVTMMPIKFLAADGSGSLDGAVQSIQFATAQNVDIMSNSWGGGGFSQVMKDAIEESKNRGILFIAAAGNNAQNTDATPSYPASYQVDNIISVAASNNRDQLASFSNYGRTTVHVSAPGVNIISTDKNGGYMNMSGTSMATPHVSGIAALIKSVNPTMSYSEIKNLIIASSDKIPSLRRASISGGRVNVFNALHGILPPAPPEPAETDWNDFSYDLESAHPYAMNVRQSTSIQVPNAKMIRVIIDRLDTEAGYDTLSIADSKNSVIERLSGQKQNYVTDYIFGDTVKINFASDASLAGWGFKISKVQAIY